MLFRCKTMLFLETELLKVYYGHLSQASVAALDFVACQSKKAANIHNRWLSCRRQRSLRSSHEQYKIVLEEGEHMEYLHSLLVFALFEDVLLSCC